MSNCVDAPATAPRRLVRPVSACLRFFRRHPARTLFLIAATALGAAALLLGIREWRFRSELDAARREVGLGHNAAAAPHLAACITMRPHHAESLLLAARTARRSGFWEDADAILAEYSKAHGDDEALAFERILLMAARGELQTAAPILIARIEAGGEQVRLAREALVTGLIYRFRWFEAERNLAVWLRSDPDDTFALMLRGKFEEQRTQTEPALNTYLRVVELDPEHDEARLRATTLLLALRRTEELIANLEHLRRRMPHLPEVRLQWVKALALQGRTEESQAALEQCLRDFPDFAPALAERGVAALRSGDDATADQYLSRAAAAAPGDYTTRSQYAAVLARRGKTAEADREKVALEQFQADQDRIGELVAGPLQSRPNDPAVPHEIALIALRSGQSSEALRWLMAALQVDPSHGPTHQLLANFHQTAGNPALAAKHRALARQFMKKP